MKKHLLSTSVIALGVAAAAPATAQNWNLEWGGFMSQHVAYKDVSTPNIAGADFDGIDTLNTSEIHFTPSVTLDNGLTFGVNIQLEGNNSGGPLIDETYMTISGDQLGRIIIGNENSAGYTSMVAAPTVTSMYINSPSISGFVPFTAASAGNAASSSLAFRQARVSSYTEVAGNNDVNRITYFTPSFNGLVLGISYANNNQNSSGNNYSVNANSGSVVSDIWDLGVNYSGTFGGTTVDLGARWGTGDVAAGSGFSDPETWGVGASVGFGAFAIGAAYAENDNGGAAGSGVGGVPDSEGWSLGATFDAAGPWSFELVTYQGSSEGLAGDDDYEAYRIGASRDLGPGVDMDVYAVFVEADGRDTAVKAVDATVIGTAINLSF